jgi:hypothetical protein
MTRYTRKEAKALGLNKCYGGVCRKHPELDGHRWVSGGCIECSREWLRARRATDPEFKRLQAKKHGAKHRGLRKKDPERHKKALEYGKAYREANKDLVEFSKRKWAAEHPELVKAYARRTKTKNKSRVVAATVKRRLSKIHRTPRWVGPEEQWLIREIYELAAMRTKALGFSWHVDHIVPLQGKTVSGLHVPSNLRVIPATVNIRKGNRL